MSTYAPEWVKVDAVRFPRAAIRRKGTNQLQIVECLSIFHENLCNADAKAFAALLSHLKEVDEVDNTVIMVQVENEVGLLGDSRDRSEAADARYMDQVPSLLIDTLQSQWSSLNDALKENLSFFKSRKTNLTASWGEVFGLDSPQTNEIFMAYHYAHYLEKITALGKAAYDLPLYTNVWLPYIPDEDEPAAQFPALVGGGAKAGDYPSGGAVEAVLDIWQLFAPSLDFVAPDIYLSHYQKTCAAFRHRGQPLFIPEQRRDEPGALRIWAAIGAHGALGVSPFGIDSTCPEVSPFTFHYGLLRQVSPHILQARAEGRSIHGFFFDGFAPGEKDTSATQTIQMGSWTLEIARAFVWGHPGPAFGLVIQLEDDKFLLIGEGFQVSFASTDSASVFTGIRSFREKEVDEDGEGGLKDGRWLNGDETRSGQAAIMPSEDPDYGGFFICISIPARTRIAECSVYSLY